MSSSPWTVFVVQHSHIDLGFTERQEVIADFHRQFIGQALTLAEFLAHLEAEVGGLPVFRGDGPDRWSDGVASAPDPAGAVMTGARRAGLSRKLALYAEHTFGYSDTVSPKLLSQQVFRRKSRLATDADEAACGTLDDVLRLRGAGAFTADRRFTYAVPNASSEARAGVAALAIDSWEARQFAGPFSVTDAAGQAYPHQMAADSRGQQVHVPLTLAAGESWALTLTPGGSG